ncbi:protein FAM161B [Ambystoma mexicanum]|uniref:protein FAM161B n=1 Tax=Ambystoma mexicanum TaxID=8296 RepID=UPI0037E96F8F
MTVSRIPEDVRRVSGNKGDRGEPDEVFPPRNASDSEAEDEVLAARSDLDRTGKLLDFLRNGDYESPSDRDFYDQLQALKIKNQQSLLELGTLYQSQTEGAATSPEEEQELERLFWENQSRFNDPQKAPRSGNLPRSGSLNCLSASSSGKNSYHHFVATPQRGSKTPTLAWASPITIPKPFNMTLREAQKKTKLRSSSVPLPISNEWLEDQKQEEAECQRQFRAFPVPAHVYLPLYEEMREQKEARRSAEIQKRRELLLSTQKPFSFVEKEERKKVETQLKMQTTAPEPASVKKTVVKKIPKSVQDPTVSDKLKEAELYRKIRIQMRAKDLLQKSAAPIDIRKTRRDPLSSTSLKTQAERLSFLQENLRFQPRTIPQVPDFDEIYRTFQRKVMKTREIKEATRNKPFNLSTSNLRSRTRKSVEDGPKEAVNSPMRRSHSLMGLSSLSSNTLPVYITDSTKKRDSAIRISMEEKQSKESEQTYWMETHRRNSEAMHKSVARRAKVLDTHKPLQETFKEKLKQNRQNDQKRSKEYKLELQEMKMRVRDRPYLFEQVSKRDARKEAERRYKSTLQEAGLSEDFVKNKGALGHETCEEELDDGAESTYEAESSPRVLDSSSKVYSGNLEEGRESPDEQRENLEKEESKEEDPET